MALTGRSGMGERIAAAACIYRGQVFTLPPPARHHTIIRHVADLHPEDTDCPLIHAGADQGFVTSAGRYVEREEAGLIALTAGQTAALKWGPPLYSEDLW
jgi:hypothetical protein